MKTSVLSLLSIILAGCTPVVTDPIPPGMPLDQEHLPEADERAVTGANVTIPPSI